MSGARLTRTETGALRVEGELTFYNVPEVLKTSLATFAGSEALEVDLSGVTRSDSAGISLVLEWTRMAHKRNKSLRFTHVPAQMLSLARVGGVDTLLAWA